MLNKEINKEIKVIYKSGLVREYDLKSFLSFSQMTINDLCNNDKLKEQGIREIKLNNNFFSCIDLSLIKKSREQQSAKIRESLNGLYKGLRLLKIFSSLDNKSLKYYAIKKALYIYKVIAQENIKDIIFVNQGDDKDSFCCSYLLREYLEGLKINFGLDIDYNKQVIYNYKGANKLTNPLTNYLTEEEIFSFDDDKLYIFCDNGLSEEAIKYFGIKYYVAFDNHTHILTDRTEIEEEIINQGLGDRNLIGSAHELLSLFDKDKFNESDWLLFCNCDSANLKGHFDKSKGQLDSLGLDIEKSNHKIDIGNIVLDNGFYKTDKPEYQHIMPKGCFKPTKAPQDIICLEPIDKIKDSQDSLSDIFNNMFSPNIKDYRFEMTLAEAIDKIKFRVGKEFNGDYEILIYNDNMIKGTRHLVNALIYKK